MSTTLYSGLGEIQKNILANITGQKDRSLSINAVMVGFVLDVITDNQSQYYDFNKTGDQTIGCVRVKLLPGDYNSKEEDIQTFAQPLDRSDYRLPLPGEQVLCIQSYGPQATGFQPILNYFQVVTTYNTITTNVEPFLGGTDGKSRSQIQNLFNNLTLKVFASRFNSKIQHDLTKTEKKTSIERLSEGDKVLQGRFGGVIKFTSTNGKDQTQRSLFPMDGTIDGDPLLIIKNDRKQDNNSLVTTTDNPNTDDAFIYLTTTQNIPKVLGCSSKLFSWDYNYIAEKQTQKIDATATYSKIVDLSIPISQSYVMNPNTPVSQSTSVSQSIKK